MSSCVILDSVILDSFTHRDTVILRVRAPAGAITLQVSSDWEVYVSLYLVSLPLFLRGVSLQEGQGHPGLRTEASLKLRKFGDIIWCSVDLEKYILEVTKMINLGGATSLACRP